MKYKSFKSKIGMFLSGAYLLIVLAVIIGMAINPPTGWAKLFPFILAMPWDFMLFDVMDKYDISSEILSPIVGYILFAFCIFLNAALLYFFGLLLSHILQRLTNFFGTPKG